eukprot:11610855-Alexandrium_andersonii.AAC.1
MIHLAKPSTLRATSQYAPQCPWAPASAPSATLALQLPVTDHRACANSLGSFAQPVLPTARLVRLASTSTPSTPASA